MTTQVLRHHSESRSTRVSHSARTSAAAKRSRREAASDAPPPPPTAAGDDEDGVYDTAPHLIPPGHPCVECGVFFSSRSARETHYDSVHLGLRPFECEHCAATFAEG